MRLPRHSAPQLPTIAGGVALQNILPDYMHSEFVNIRDRVKPPNLWEHPLPRACHRLSKSDEVDFLLRLREVGMGDFVPESDLYVRDRLGRLVLPVGGFFAVAHKQDSDRLIYDRRPANAIMRPFKFRARLPHSSSFTKLIIEPSQTVRGSMDDLRCMFYCLQQPPQGELLNGVGRRWTGRQIGLQHLGRHVNYRFALRVQGIGDLSAVDIAQHTHESILQTHGCLEPAHHLHFDETVPASHTWEGVYIDDKCVCQVLPRADLANTSLDYHDAVLVERGEAAYEATHCLEQVTEKRLRLSESIVAWGTAVQGRVGRVAAPDSKCALTCACLAAAISKGKIDKKSFEQILGSLIHPFQHRTELMCILSDSYVFVHGI